MQYTLNGKKVTYEGNASDRLLDVLRDICQCTSVKIGCNEGECGACSIILDGKLSNACMLAMGRVSDCEVITMEGYRDTPQFEVLARCFGETGAIQCGFCTPGMVLAAHCLLMENPKPTEAEIRVGLSGNICRCTGYNAIVNAVAKAAKEGAGLWP